MQKSDPATVRTLCFVRSTNRRRILLTEPTSGRYWSTSGWGRSHRASRRHAGLRCGMSAMHRWVMVSRVPTLSQIGMKRPNRPRTLRSISASVGKGGQQRFYQRCGGGLRLSLLGRERCRKTSGSGPLATARSDLAQWRGNP
jgi:hypothetical protein